MVHAPQRHRAASLNTQMPSATLVEPPPQNIPRGRGVVTRPPLDPLVICDIERLLGAFEASNLRSLASFKALAGQFRVRDLFLTRRAGNRVGPVGESPGEYASLLFECIVRRAVEPSRSYETRLGAIYLLLLLHELQPSEPHMKAPWPMTSPEVTIRSRNVPSSSIELWAFSLRRAMNGTLTRKYWTAMMYESQVMK